MGALMVHTLDHVRAALAAASGLGRPVLLVTAPGAADYAGPRFLKAMIDRAAIGFPSAEWDALIDCGALGGTAFAALDAGWRRLAVADRGAVATRLGAIAAARGARVEPLPNSILDLGREADPRGAARTWLRDGRVAGASPVC
jgi:hypothetical protein